MDFVGLFWRIYNSYTENIYKIYRKIYKISLKILIEKLENLSKRKNIKKTIYP